MGSRGMIVTIAAPVKVLQGPHGPRIFLLGLISYMWIGKGQVEITGISIFIFIFFFFAKFHC